MNAKSSTEFSLILLVVWAILCAIWNAYGAAQLARGGQALGPTATIMGALLAISLAIVLIISFRNRPSAYRWLTLVPCVISAMTIWSALRLDPALWPSEFWRWAGILVNAIGVVGSALAFLTPRKV